jgi:uncharacterized protein (DUF58 family)
MVPRPRLILLVALLAVPLGLGALYPEVREVGVAALVLLAAVAIVDVLLSPAPRTLVITREVPPVMSVGSSHRVLLRLVNRSSSALRVEVTDTPPEPGQTTGLPLSLEVPARATREIGYTVVPLRRGRRAFGDVHLRYPTRLGLTYRTEQRPLPEPVRVYPDLHAVHRFELLARKNRLAETGLKVWRLRGQGGEFDRLREYRREDEPRHIDWKATAKTLTLITREYTVERNQNVLFLLDCGRSMVNETDGLSHLDRGLNASVILSYIALAQGDNVGFIGFSDRIERAVGPLRGKPAITTLVRELFDLEPRYEASDYGLAIDEITRRQRKRALVILVTHALDEQHLIAVGEHARSLTRNHLLLCVLLRDVGLAALASTPPRTDLDAFRAAAAAEMLAAQGRQVSRLREAGVLIIETVPAELSAAVVNQYLDLKARHLL